MRRALFALARELGMTVAEVEHRMSARELAEWFALSRIERDEQGTRDLVARAEQSARGARRR